jgi:hypothetical protein
VVHNRTIGQQIEVAAAAAAVGRYGATRGVVRVEWGVGGLNLDVAVVCLWRAFLGVMCPRVFTNQLLESQSIMGVSLNRRPRCVLFCL